MNEKVLVLGSFFTDNLGDQAILQAEAELFQDICGCSLEPFPFKPGKYVGDRRDREVTRLLPQVWHIPRHLHALYRRARTADAVVVGGGNLLQDNSVFTPFLTLLTFLTLRLATHRIYVLAVGVGQFRTPLSKPLYGRALSFANRVSVRDSTSYAVLSDVIGDRRLRLVCDPALAMRQEGEVSTQWKVGLVARPHRHPVYEFGESEEVYRKYLASMGETVSGCIERFGTDGLVLFTSELPHDSVVIDDLSGYDSRFAQVTRLRPSSVEELLATVRSADVIVSSRLHPILLAISQGRPAIGVNVSTKIEAFFQSVGLTEFCVSPGDAGERVPSLVAELAQGREARDYGLRVEHALKESRDALREEIGFVCGHSSGEGR